MSEKPPRKPGPVESRRTAAAFGIRVIGASKTPLRDFYHVFLRVPWPVALAFIGVILVTMSDIGPAGGMLVVAVGLIATVTLELRAWSAGTPGDREAAAVSFDSLPARLQQAQPQQPPNHHQQTQCRAFCFSPKAAQT